MGAVVDVEEVAQICDEHGPTTYGPPIARPDSRHCRRAGDPGHGQGSRSVKNVSPAAPTDSSTTRLGDWYVNVLFWKPQVALFVSEATLLPVLVPFAPAASLTERFPAAVITHLQAHEVPRSFTDAERAAMADVRLAKTASRSVLGVMNEFRFLADVYRHDGETDLRACRCASRKRRAARCTAATSAPIGSSRRSWQRLAQDCGLDDDVVVRGRMIDEGDCALSRTTPARRWSPRSTGDTALP